MNQTDASSLKFRLVLMANTKRLWRKDIALKYETDLRTVDRWKSDGTLPKPRRWHGRPYWTEAQLKLAERVEIRKWNAQTERRLKQTRKLREAALRVKLATGQINEKQLALNLF